MAGDCGFIHIIGQLFALCPRVWVIAFLICAFHNAKSTLVHRLHLKSITTADIN